MRIPCYVLIYLDHAMKNGGPHTVIASHRVGATRRPMTGSAKQSICSVHKGGLLRRFAPLRKRFAFVAGNDGGE
jgi:hypothetical protein